MARQRETTPERAPGAIVNMSSVNAWFGLPDHVADSMSKGGIMQLTKAMAISLASLGIRVNAIGPGTILTDLVRKTIYTSDAARAAVMSRTPMGRAGEVEEIASDEPTAAIQCPAIQVRQGPAARCRESVGCNWAISPGATACGGVILDAMARGVPAVAVASDPAQQLVVSGETGWIVPPLPESEFPRRAFNLLEKPDEAARCGAAARARAIESFPVARMIAGFAAAIDELA
jgi:hypothetical protein